MGLGDEEFNHRPGHQLTPAVLPDFDEVGLLRNQLLNLLSYFLLVRDHANGLIERRRRVRPSAWRTHRPKDTSPHRGADSPEARRATARRSLCDLLPCSEPPRRRGTRGAGDPTEGCSRVKFSADGFRSFQYPRWACASMMPGMTVLPVRSTRAAPSGACTSPRRPTEVNLPSCTTNAESSMGGASSPVISRAPSNKVALRAAAGGWLAGGAAHAATKSMRPDRITIRHSPHTSSYGRVIRCICALGVQPRYSKRLLQCPYRRAFKANRIVGRPSAAQVHDEHSISSTWRQAWPP